MRTRASVVVGAVFCFAGAAAGQSGDVPNRLPPLGTVEPLTVTTPPPEIEPAQYVRPAATPNRGPTSAAGIEAVVDPAVPVVKIQVRIPKDAPPGQPVKCQVYVTNSAAADAYEVRVRVPMKGLNAQLESASPKADPPGKTTGEYAWTFGKLKGNSQEKIEMTLTPAAGAEAINLKAYVRFEYGEQVETKISAPKLKIEKTAPTEVAVGEPIPVRVVIRNVGPVPMKNVRVVEQVTAGFEYAENTDGEKTKEPGQREWKFDLIRPSEAKVIAYQVSAKKAGSLTAQTVVAGGSGTQVNKDVKTEVRTPGLKVDLAVPRAVDANESGLFRATVSNSGTMTLHNVKLAVSFATDCTVTKMTEGGKQYRDQVVWTVPKLGPGDAPKEYRVWIKAPAPGRKTIRATATSARGTTHTASGETVFQGTADLVWETIPDPARVAAGNFGSFTVRVKNTGTEAAKNTVVRVKIPAEVKATQISPKFNQGGDEIAFQSVTIPAGKSETYTITFRGSKAGQATFEASLSSDALGEKPLKAEKAVTITSGR
ncbi:MAG TPA: hypothetical protein VGJ05_00220 [Fimbriiglobus sp.]|jgi:uncharacterized repeat protein (TIGR01451 family)